MGQCVHHASGQTTNYEGDLKEIDRGRPYIKQVVYSNKHRCTAINFDQEDMESELIILGVKDMVKAKNMVDGQLYRFFFNKLSNFCRSRGMGSNRRTKDALDTGYIPVVKTNEVYLKNFYNHDYAKYIIAECRKLLTFKQQQVIYLAIYGDLVFKDIGVVLGISASTAYQHYVESIKKLKNSRVLKQLWCVGEVTQNVGDYSKKNRHINRAKVHKGEKYYDKNKHTRYW